MGPKLNELHNERVKWWTNFYTTIGMSLIVLSGIKPLVDGSGIENLSIFIVSFFPLALGYWNLSNLRYKNG